MKRVITIHKATLCDESTRLMDAIHRSGFDPDLIVGIATGGVLVVEAMEHTGARRFSCELRRTSTERRSRSPLFQRVVSRLPYIVSDRLRQLEDVIGQRLPLDAKAPPETGPAFHRDIDAIVQAAVEDQARNILVVDDAVDSGVTLAAVVQSLRHQLRNAVDVRSAAITVTRPPGRRLVSPDYVLYEDTLCRFPWSFDYREPGG